MGINSKQKEIIFVLKSNNHPTKSSELAKKLDVSSRTVIKYISDINSELKKTVIISSRDGYCLNSNIDIDSLLQMSDDFVPQSFDDRSFFVFRKMLTEHTDQLDIYDLCQELFLSYSAVKNLIQKMNNRYGSAEVQIVCSRDKIKLVGNEKSKRKLIGLIIMNSSQNSYVNFAQLEKCFPDIEIDHLRKIIYSTFKNHDFYLNNYTAMNYIIHLLIIINRKLIDEDTNTYPRYGWVSIDINNLVFDLISQLENEFDVSFDEPEINDIIVLTNIAANYTLPLSNTEVKKIVGEDIIELTKRYIKDIKQLYMIDLDTDAFSVPFCLHLKNLIYRASQDKFVKNPLADSIKQNSPLVFDVAIYISLDLSKRYSLSLAEDEVAFLAMHIGAEVERQNSNSSKLSAALVCNSYSGLNQQISNKLMLMFGDIINIDKNVLDENELKGDEYDVIFAINQINDPGNAVPILISPFNLRSQSQYIEEALNKRMKTIRNMDLKFNLHNYISEDLFFPDSKLQNKDDVLSFLFDILLQKQYIEKDFLESVYRREKAATTAFKNIAIPHSMDMNAIKTCISIVTSKNGITWGDVTVNVVLLIAINKFDKVLFKDLYEQTIELFNEKSFIQEVVNCTSFEEFEDTLISNLEL